MPPPGGGAADASVAVLIESILNKHGFDEFKKASDEVVGRAKKMKAGLEDAGQGQDNLAKKTRSAKAEVSIFTARMLQSVGATREGAIAAQVAGVGYEAFALGLSATSIALSGLTLAVGIIIPMIQKFLESGKLSKDAVTELKNELYGSLPAMAQYKDALDEMTIKQRGLLQVERDRSLAEQQKEIDKNKEAAVGLRKEIERLLGPTTKWELQAHAMGESLVPVLTGATKENTKAASDLAMTLADLEVKTAALEEAQRTGKTIAETYADAQERANQKAREAAALAEKLKRGQDGVNDAIREGTSYVDQDALAKDSAALADKEAAARKGQLTDELIEQLTVFDEQANARREMTKEEGRADKQRVKDTRAFNAEMVATGTAGLTTLFGKNKVARIAQAIADTYAAANVALATPAPWPAPAIFAALAIATGLANVASIRKQEVGFDNPVSDLMAERLGVKFAEDFIRHVQAGFDGRVGGLAGGGGGGGVVHNSYRYDNSTQIGTFRADGYFATSKTQLLTKLERDLRVIRRREARGTIGGASRL
jgi:hypothetical protein